MLSPEIVAALAGRLAPEQYAQAAPSVAGQPIGQVETLNGSAQAVRTSGLTVQFSGGRSDLSGRCLADRRG